MGNLYTIWEKFYNVVMETEARTELYSILPSSKLKLNKPTIRENAFNYRTNIPILVLKLIYKYKDREESYELFVDIKNVLISKQEKGVREIKLKLKHRNHPGDEKAEIKFNFFYFLPKNIIIHEVDEAIFRIDGFWEILWYSDLAMQFVGVNYYVSFLLTDGGRESIRILFPEERPTAQPHKRLETYLIPMLIKRTNYQLDAAEIKQVCKKINENAKIFNDGLNEIYSEGTKTAEFWRWLVWELMTRNSLI